MVRFWRKPQNPDPALKLKIAGFGQDNYSAIPIRLTEPIQVNHTITRNIPRPSYIEFIVERADGVRFSLGSVDVSYRRHMELLVYPAMLDNSMFENSVPPVRLMVRLEYDPKDS